MLVGHFIILPSSLASDHVVNVISFALTNCFCCGHGYSFLLAHRGLSLFAIRFRACIILVLSDLSFLPVIGDFLLQIIVLSSPDLDQLIQIFFSTMLQTLVRQMPMSLDRLNRLIDHGSNFRNNARPFRTLRGNCKIFILHVCVTNGHQVLEHALFDADDVRNFIQGLTLDSLHLNFVQIEQVVCHEGHKSIPNGKAVFFEHLRVLHVMHFRLKEAGDFVRFEKEFAGHDLHVEECADEEALVTFIFQLSLAILIEKDQFLLERKQEVFCDA